MVLKLARGSSLENREPKFSQECGFCSKVQNIFLRKFTYIKTCINELNLLQNLMKNFTTHARTHTHARVLVGKLNSFKKNDTIKCI